MATKYIFVTGGVVSSLGKGVSAAAIGWLLKNRGLKVFIQKFDPYINVDPGLMSPFQHGEVFVTKDGAQTDLDLGHYERFIDIELSQDSSITTGKIYQAVIDKERLGLYDGATVQVIPHITNEIKQRLIDAAQNSQADVIITEIGGTVGDIESLPFLEAIRQFRRDVGFKNTIYVHNTLVPYLPSSKEIKTKPTQHSVKELRTLGITPDILILRSQVKIDDATKEKIALFCDVEDDGVFESLDVDVIYQAIINMHEQKIDDFILKHFRLTLPPANVSVWHQLISKIQKMTDEIEIAIVGKYVALPDAYISLIEALNHAGFALNKKVKINWVDAEKVTKDNIRTKLSKSQGIIIPGGFGQRATLGKLLVIEHARINNIPLLGICYGMQLMLIEYAKNVLGIKNASSTELKSSNIEPIIDLINPNTVGVQCPLRLGAHEMILMPGSKILDIYQTTLVTERHRHRYHFNLTYEPMFKGSDLQFSGFSHDDGLEVIELINHPYFIGVQFHPEFISRPLRPHPLFISFLKESIKNK